LPIAITSVDLTQVTQDPVYPLDTVDFSANLLPNDATKPYTYTIYYDDGTVLTDTSSLDPLLLSHAFTAIGTYSVTIEALNEGMTVPVTDNLNVTILNPFPEAEFSSNSPVFLGEPVLFTNESTGQEPITYAWDFGDGATSSEKDPSHTYTAIGTYTVTLTVTGKGTDIVTHPVAVLPIALTSVDLSQVTPDPIYAGETVEFSADLLPDDATMPYTYTIDYGDTISSTSIANDEPISLSHVYIAVGDYIVQIEVLNVGMTVPVTDSLDLSVLVPGSPYAAFSTNSPVQLGQAVEFANLTIGDEPITYQWDFGDGIGSSTDISPTYTYAEIGLYTVTLTATNDLGVDSISHTVTVQPIAITSVDLTQVSTGTIFPGDTVEFSVDLLPEDATKPYYYTIDYGDGTVISGTSDLDPYPFEHVFTSNGWHTVQISVWNAGMTDPITNSLDILVAYKFLLPITVK
jgi:PKD repeat protein